MEDSEPPAGQANMTIPVQPKIKYISLLNKNKIYIFLYFYKAGYKRPAAQYWSREGTVSPSALTLPPVSFTFSSDQYKCTKFTHQLQHLRFMVEPTLSLKAIFCFHQSKQSVAQSHTVGYATVVETEFEIKTKHFLSQSIYFAL